MSLLISCVWNFKFWMLKLCDKSSGTGKTRNKSTIEFVNVKPTNMFKSLENTPKLKKVRWNPGTKTWWDPNTKTLILVTKITQVLLFQIVGCGLWLLRQILPINSSRYSVGKLNFKTSSTLNLGINHNHHEAFWSTVPESHQNY